MEPLTAIPGLGGNAISDILDAAPELGPAEYGEILSPSQVSTWIGCSARSAFAKVYGLKEPPTVASAIGKAIHVGLGTNFAQKIESGVDLPAEDVAAIADRVWRDESADVRFDAKQDPAELGRRVGALTSLYMIQQAPSIDPVAVEVEVEGTVTGTLDSGEVRTVNVRGIVDVLEIMPATNKGKIRDFKTICTKPAGMRTADRMQTTLYSLITPGASELVQIDYLVKTKDKPQIVPIEHHVTASDIQLVESVFPRVQAEMRSGVYTPRRGSKTCCRLMCGFASVCEEAYGGTVPYYPEAN